MTPGFLKDTFFTLDCLLDGNNFIILFCLLEDNSNWLTLFLLDVSLNLMVDDFYGVDYLKILIEEFEGTKLS
jgi:hypothetical protein